MAIFIAQETTAAAAAALQLDAAAVANHTQAVSAHARPGRKGICIEAHIIARLEAMPCILLAESAWTTEVVCATPSEGGMLVTSVDRQRQDKRSAGVWCWKQLLVQ